MSLPSQTAEVFDTDRGQAVRLPADIRFSTSTVVVRREGESVILETPRPSQWPVRFFESIRIEDPAFERPDQGSMPPPPNLP